MGDRTHDRRAGTAYLEALGVSLVLVLLFACAARFARVGQARLEDARRARASAWAEALRGCEPSERSFGSTDATEAFRTLRPQAARDVLEHSLARDASAERATSQVACNEPAPLERAEQEAAHFIASVLAEAGPR